MVVDTGPLITLAVAQSLDYRLQGDESGILLCEETALLKRVVVRDRERIVELSTLDFLRIIETEQLIYSADKVFELAAKAGRLASRVSKIGNPDEATPIAIHQLVKRRDADPEC